MGSSDGGRLLESEAPTHEERKATVCGVRVALREVARAPRGGAVASHRQQRALRARGGHARARRGRRPARHPRARARPRAPRVPRTPRARTQRPLPTHWHCATRAPGAAFRAVARPTSK